MSEVTSIKVDAAQRLRRNFHPSEVRQRTQSGLKLDYIDIATTINRFLDEMGLDWEWTITKTELIDADKNDRRGNKLWIGLVEGAITVHDDGNIITRSGVGAGESSDPDMAVKTAMAEALKKAGHTFGVGLYLWDEGERDAVGAYRDAMASNSVPALKKLVAKLAQDQGIESVTKENLAGFFNVTEADLDNPDVLRKILS